MYAYGVKFLALLKCFDFVFQKTQKITLPLLWRICKMALKI